MLALLPSGTKVEQLSSQGLAPGLLSAGLGSVPAEQTYLDIGQGNRVFDSLYDSQLPESERCGPGFWRAVDERADSAPAEIVPGLLFSTLQAAGVGVRVGVGTSCTFLAIQSRTASGDSAKKLSGGPHPHLAQTLLVENTTVRHLRRLAVGLRGDDLLIAIERPPPPKNHALSIGIAGRGFDGNLTSDSTRTNGYVLSTDIAPTILERFGIAVPSQMSGQPIRSEGAADAAAVESLGARMAEISARRAPVIGLALAIWLGALALAIVASRGRAARFGLELVGLAVVYLPLVLLLGAALEPSLAAEQALTVAGAPLLALITLLALRGYRALAAASATVVLAYAADMIAGSPLTSLSLLGPNPALGVRFYGIGNELEALLAVLVVAGTGAALTGFVPSPPAVVATWCRIANPSRHARRRPSSSSVSGSRSSSPPGASAPTSARRSCCRSAPPSRRRRSPPARRRAVLLVVAAPVAVVCLLALIDLVSGANAHLTRSVLDAGGLNDLADVAQRRLQLSAQSFARPIVFAFMPLLVAAAALAVARRDLLAAWLRGRPAMRAGLIGAVAATVVGTLANDSGALLLEIGSAYLLVFLAFVWAESDRPETARGIVYACRSCELLSSRHIPGATRAA